MPDLLEVLFFYSEENRGCKYLQTPEYRRAVLGLEERWDAFRAALTPEQARTLDGLLSEEAKAGLLSGKAAFQAALTIGMDLGRL